MLISRGQNSVFSARSVCSYTSLIRGEVHDHIDKKDVNRGGELKFVFQYRPPALTQQPEDRVIKLLSRLNTQRRVPFPTCDVKVAFVILIKQIRVLGLCLIWMSFIRAIQRSKLFNTLNIIFICYPRVT